MDNAASPKSKGQGHVVSFPIHSHYNLPQINTAKLDSFLCFTILSGAQRIQQMTVRPMPHVSASEK